MSNSKGNFKKAMRPIDVWGLALGAIIGWGCFVLPGSAFLPKAGPLGTAMGMLIGGGIGNMIDRIALGYVVDFLDFCAFPNLWMWVFTKMVWCIFLRFATDVCGTQVKLSRLVMW